MYLLQMPDGTLGMTKMYQDPLALFCFKHFDKNADVNKVTTGDMSFLRAGTGEYVTVDSDSGSHDVSFKSEEDKFKRFYIRMRQQEMLPDSDALLLSPVRPSALKAVVQVRRLVLVLIDYKNQLLALPDVASSTSASSLRQSNSSSSNRSEEGVIEVTRDCYKLLSETLRKLVVNLSWGEIPDPMSRDGIPNRLLQKILRELKVVPLVVEIIQLPFQKVMVHEHDQIYNQKTPKRWLARRLVVLEIP